MGSGFLFPFAPALAGLAPLGGAQGAFLTPVLGQPPAGANPDQLVNVWLPQRGKGTRLELGFGEVIPPTLPSPGIVFTLSARPPGNNAGSFQFVQAVTQTNHQVLTNPAQNGGVQVARGNLGTGLDNWYPYPVTYDPTTGQALSPLQTGDYPSLNLALSTGAPIAESEYTFGASMYLMWDPALPGPEQTGGCHAASNDPTSGSPPQPNPQPSTCTGSIPVPLGYLTWGFTGDAINTLNTGAPGNSNGTGWLMVNCGGPNPATPAAQPQSAFLVGSYPTWNFTVQNSQ